MRSAECGVRTRKWGIGGRGVLEVKVKVEVEVEVEVEV